MSAVMLGTPGALILVYLTQLPLFVAGLWLGVGAAAAAGVTGSLVLLAVSDLLGAALFAALNAVPVDTAGAAGAVGPSARRRYAMPGIRRAC